MALTFATNSLKLANWGFSAGDIAVIAGAGRQVITWLTANSRDQGLLEVLGTSQFDLPIRRGLVDPVALNRRWSKKISLFRNGRKVEAQPEGTTSELENLNLFTWIMTILVACLDEVVTDQTLRKIIINLSEKLFEAAPAQLEYLVHEIPEHINGWHSTAVTRMMVSRARDIWRSLEEEKIHLPGYAPEMGFDVLKAGSRDTSFPESYAVVILDDSLVQPSEGSLTHIKRRGMRIPLDSMAEAVSLWPGTVNQNNHRRTLFKTGMRAASTLTFCAIESRYDFRSNHGISVSSSDSDATEREDPDIFRLAERFLLVTDKKAMKGLTEMVDYWHIPGEGYREIILSGLSDVTNVPGRKYAVPMAETTGKGYGNYKGDLQVFLLGYYYGAWSSIMDTGRLELKEGFGSWGWDDDEFFRHINAFVKSGVKNVEDGERRGGIFYRRFQVLRMAAYLFAGAESHQLEALNSSSAGIHAKLTIITAGLLGEADTPEKITKLYMLDIDPTCIPSSGLGIISPAKQSDPEVNFFISPALDLSVPLSEPIQRQDFTAHIEPAWGYDSTLCLVTYRHHGRLVHRVDPSESEAAVLEWWNKAAERDIVPTAGFRQSVESIATHVLSKNASTQIYTGQLSDFYTTRGGSIAMPALQTTEPQPVGHPLWVYILPTENMCKARTCIVAMYSRNFADRMRGWEDFSWHSKCPKALAIGVETREPSFGNGTVVLL
jgi:hypothetical protein